MPDEYRLPSRWRSFLDRCLVALLIVSASVWIIQCVVLAYGIQQKYERYKDYKIAQKIADIQSRLGPEVAQQASALLPDLRESDQAHSAAGMVKGGSLLLARHQTPNADDPRTIQAARDVLWYESTRLLNLPPQLVFLVSFAFVALAELAIIFAVVNAFTLLKERALRFSMYSIIR